MGEMETLGEGVEVEVLTPGKSQALFDRRARSLFGVSGAEFIRRYEAGEIDENDETLDHSAVVEMAMLLPFACADTARDEEKPDDGESDADGPYQCVWCDASPQEVEDLCRECADINLGSER